MEIPGSVADGMLSLQIWK